MLSASSKRVDITPPIGLRMAGFSERTHGAVGILNSLYASVLVLSNGQNKVAVVEVDLIGIDNDLLNKVRTAVAEKTDIRQEAVMIAATHTHSGPQASRLSVKGDVFPIEGILKEDEHYYNSLVDKIVGTVIWANETLQDATVQVAQSDLYGIASNRIDPSRYCDHRVTVFNVVDRNGDMIALLTNFACHPTVLNYESYLYSGDFISFYREAIRKIYPDAIPMYIQGCCGDVSTRHDRRGFGKHEAERLGMLLAGEALKNAMLAKPIEGDSIQAVIKPLILHVRDYESDAICLQKIEEAAERMRRLKDEDAPENIQRTAYVEWQGATRNYRLKKSIDYETFDTEMQLLQIGDWKIVTTPGETFGAIGDSIRVLDCNNKTIVSAYSNGYVGYIPTLETYLEPKGYEVGVALVRQDSEERMIETAKQLFERIHDGLLSSC